MVGSDDSLEMNEILSVYNKIKHRKLEQIKTIESILYPIVSEYPEVQKVLEIIEKWKPRIKNSEGGHLQKS